MDEGLFNEQKTPMKPERKGKGKKAHVENEDGEEYFGKSLLSSLSRYIITIGFQICLAVRPISVCSDTFYLFTNSPTPVHSTNLGHHRHSSMVADLSHGNNLPRLLMH